MIHELRLLTQPLVGFLGHQFVREAFLLLEAVVLAARHGEGDADARLHVDEVTKGAETVGVDQYGVVLDGDVSVQDGQCLVEPAQLQLGGQQVLLQLVTDFLQLDHFFLQSAAHHSSSGALKMTDMKMQDVKLMDQVAGHEIARRENAGQKIRALTEITFVAVCNFWLLLFS